MNKWIAMVDQANEIIINTGINRTPHAALSAIFESDACLACMQAKETERKEESRRPFGWFDSMEFVIIHVRQRNKSRSRTKQKLNENFWNFIRCRLLYFGREISIWKLSADSVEIRIQTVGYYNTNDIFADSLSSNRQIIYII